MSISWTLVSNLWNTPGHPVSGGPDKSVQLNAPKPLIFNETLNRSSMICSCRRKQDKSRATACLRHGFPLCAARHEVERKAACAPCIAFQQECNSALMKTKVARSARALATGCCGAPDNERSEASVSLPNKVVNPPP